MRIEYGETARELAARFDFRLLNQLVDFEPIDLGLLVRDPFRIGIIVGPSGSGKTQAMARLGDLSEPRWNRDRVVADHFADADSAIRYLFAAGLASVPQMLKPHHVLSNGEQYRANLARRLSERQPDSVLCIDEFTSVVDRTVAQSLCASIDSYLVGDARVILSTCHYDVIDWIRPCWVVNTVDASVMKGIDRPAARWRMWTGSKLAEFRHE